MPKVTVSRPQTINVRVNQQQPQVVHGTSTFVGASDVQNQVNQALSQSNVALSLAQSAYNKANTALPLAGGTITGNLTVLGDITATEEIIDGGTFT